MNSFYRRRFRNYLANAKYWWVVLWFVPFSSSQPRCAQTWTSWCHVVSSDGNRCLCLRLFFQLPWCLGIPWLSSRWAIDFAECYTVICLSLGCRRCRVGSFGAEVLFGSRLFRGAIACLRVILLTYLKMGYFGVVRWIWLAVYRDFWGLFGSVIFFWRALLWSALALFEDHSRNCGMCRRRAFEL